MDQDIFHPGICSDDTYPKLRTLPAHQPSPHPLGPSNASSPPPYPHSSSSHVHDPPHGFGLHPFPAGYTHQHDGDVKNYAFSDANKENKLPIIITAPVPLSYAARSKAALRSILSAGDDESPPPHGHQDPTNEHIPNTNISYAQFQNTEQTQLWTALKHAMLAQPEDLSQISHPAQISSHSAQHPPTIMRSISPSTLIALTEPCLMKWCLDAESELLRKLEPTDPVFLGVGDGMQFGFGFLAGAEGLSAVPMNSWGY